PLFVRVSINNVVAFISSYELISCNSSNKDLKRDKSKPFCNVYVCDIVSPWNVFLVTRKTMPITILEWDPSGEHLLIGDTQGRLEIWGKINHLLSDWNQLHYVNLPGETIIQAEFFHSGRTMTIAFDKRDNNQYMEKFQNVKYIPSVRKFGGIAENGCLVVTSTGLLGAFLIPYNNSSSTAASAPTELLPVTETLGLVRNFVTTAAISYAKIPNRSGYFRVAVTNTEMKSDFMVHCFRVELSLVNNKLSISSKSLPAFFGTESNDQRKITKLKWMITNDFDSLIVTENLSSTCVTNMWTLTHKPITIHKYLQTAGKTDVFKHYSWTNQFQYESQANVVAVTLTKNPFDNVFVYLLMNDNTIHILRRDLKLVSTTNYSIVENIFKMEHIGKIPRIDKQLVALDITFMSHLLVTVDNLGDICTFKVPQFYTEQCSNQMQLVNYKTTLLEYCLVTGYDASDVLMTMKPNYIENVLEKMSDNFSRQNSSTQQFYYVNSLTMKTNLARLLPNGQMRVNDLSSLIMLHSILVAFKSLLRPSELTNYEKGPSESLAMVLSESNPDIDKVLMNLDAKDFTLESSILPSLQQLIQWVADLALNILTRLPLDNFKSTNINKSTDYDICKDIVALNSIRELLVLGTSRQKLSSVFTKSAENIDILVTLFRLLTKLSFNPSEPDEVLVDDCCSLPTQVVIPPSVTNSINSPSLTLHLHPQQFQYNIEPDFLRYSRQNILEDNNNDVFMDGISHYVMGKNPQSMKHCLRCGTSTYIKNLAKTVAMNAWEHRWSSGCICGGQWTLLKN
uniref:Mediator of RNA polymerase II transcription subunit 16 n=1 Tax=Megaselia scalaris TaxID=36166 RepID=T1GWC6_MEGSC